MPEYLKNTLKAFQRYSNHRWYLPLMSLLVFLDLFVGFIPSDAVLVKTVLLKPSRWWYSPLILSTTSALGAVLLGYLADAHGTQFIEWIVPNLLTSPEWQKTHHFIDKHGPWAMAVISISPLPQQPAVIFCGLADMGLPTLFAAVWLGRAPKYFLLGWLAMKSPKFFEKHFKGLYDELQTLKGPSEPEEPSSGNHKKKL